MTFKPGHVPSTARATATHCANKHPWTAQTTRFTSKGGKRCRLCDALWRGDGRKVYGRRVFLPKPAPEADPSTLIEKARYEMELDFRLRRRKAQLEAIRPELKAMLERAPTFRELLGYMEPSER